MSEENTNQESTQETTSETKSPSLDLDSTIKVDGKEVSVKDLIDSRNENLQLKEYNEQARKLISPNNTDEESREKAVRFLMTEEGYSPDDINEYINWTNEVQEGNVEGQEEPVYQVPEYDGTQQENSNEDLQQQYYQEKMMREQEQQRMSEIEERQARIGTEMMKKEMSNALDSIMASNEQVSKLMGVNQDNEGRTAVLRQEVESAMMDSLRKRRASGENFSNSWFSEEAGNAAKTVYDKFSSVIGDPDLIQRAPETATEDSLFNKPPVDPPKYETGDSMGDINIKTREYTLDTLLRGAREGAAGGKSKA